jgi:hypothetical protein
MSTAELDFKWARNAHKKINKMNKQFLEASPAKKRVMAAKDLIKLLAGGFISAGQGAYLVVGPSDEESLKANSNTQLQDLFLDPKTFPDCTVCAIGGALLVCARLGDKMKIGETNAGYGIEISGEGESEDIGGGWSRSKQVVEIFGEDRLSHMERSFEHNSGTCDQLSDVSDSTLRLFGIYENIILNKGEYSPGRTKGLGHDLCVKELPQSGRLEAMKSKNSKENDAWLREMHAFEKGLKRRFKIACAMAKIKKN